MSAVRSRPRLGAFSDGAIIRAAFFVMLAGTLAVLYIDWRELNAADVSAFVAPDAPILPAFDPNSPNMPAGPAVTTDPDLLRQTLVVALGPGGVLSLTGTIDPGAYDRVAAEIAARGEYVKVVSLSSPGGAVEEALKIGTLLREKGLTTRVEAGALCASSCPLVFAGGKAREAEAGAAIGVHQIYAAARAGDPPPNAGDAVSSTQRTTAEVSRYLEAGGIDPALWLNALETPTDRLYYLSAAQMAKYRLTTEPPPLAATNPE